MKKSVKLTIPVNPIPKVRITYRSKWSKRAKRSLEYQKLIAGYWMTKKTEIRLTGNLYLKCIFYRNDKRRIDIDNLVKIVQDGLQYGQAFEDDSQIKKIEADLCYDKDNPRTEIEIGML